MIKTGGCLIELPLRSLAEGTEETREILPRGWHMLWSNFERSTFRIHAQNLTAT